MEGAGFFCMFGGGARRGAGVSQITGHKQAKVRVM